MRLELERMLIENFKGCSSMELDLSAHTRVFGMNGIGKTTIVDAFSWCLWNKDSHGNAPGSDAFRDKPLDEDGKEVHNLDTTVELICKLDGQQFNIRRTQRENWVKKRGYADAVYQGNASTYWINGVETKLADFKARISQIASEDLFRLIASLSAFNSLDWKKRREQLLTLSGGDVDGSLLEQAKYRLIADECAQRNIGVDDLRKVLADQRKRTNDDLKMLPVRIDEAKRTLPEFKPNELSDAEYVIADSQKDLAHIDEYIAEIKAKSGATGSRMKVLSLEQELVSLKRRVGDELMSGKKVLQSEADAASTAFRSVSGELALAKMELSKRSGDLNVAIAERDDLRREFTEVRNAAMPDVDTVCPCCGQSLPADAVERAKEKLVTDKRAKLNGIKEKGKEAAAKVEERNDAVAEMQHHVEELSAKVDKAMEERDAAFEKLKNYPSEPDYSTEPRIAEVMEQLEEEKQAAATAPDEKIQELEARKKELQAIIDSKRALFAKRDAGIETQKRIAELEEKKKSAGAMVSEIERLLDLCDQFVKDRCGALESSINEKFPTVRWKLFDIQINGGIVDTCSCMIPCDSGLVAYESANTAAKVHADCEIIDVLSKHYDVSLPVFIDNAERCNTLPKMDVQTIELYVSTDDKLRVCEA